jgi:alkanesulfonate monooxygenase SsuD/methylene tetrahydromethanopterin reductase-like flavin-dependent oxidoreductase (luciferase family)
MEFLIYHPVLRSPRAVIDEAPALERLGFDGLVMPDHLYVLDFQSGVPLPYPHPLPVLAAAAAVTSRLKLLALVSNNLARGPVELAQQTATLANLAPGRVELALGAGWFEAEHVAAGVGFPSGADRVRRLVESVSICRRLFAEGTVDHQGEHYLVQVPTGGFVTVDAPIPIMVGAAAPAMIRAAARVADRVDLQPDALRGGGADLARYNSYTFEQLAAGAERAMEAAVAASRSIRVSASPFVLVTADEAEGADARQTMAEFLGLEPAVLEQSFGTLIGSADEVAAKLARYSDAGCDRVHLQALNGDAAARIAPLLAPLRAA